MQLVAENKWQSYGDYFRKSSYSNFPQEHRSSPGRLRCSMVLADMGQHDYSDPQVPELMITSPIEVLKQGEIAWNYGDGWTRETWAPGSIYVCPPNVSSEWRAESTRRTLMLLIPIPTLKKILGTSTPANLSAAFLPLSTSTWRDTFTQSLILRMWESAKSQNISDCLVTDGLLTTLLGLLLERAGGPQRPGNRIALSPARLRRVMEFVEENLHSSLDVNDLAGIAGLSNRHFARAFSQEVGESPHRWLMQKRMERAKRLLLETGMDCMSIAERCGFASQSHMTVAMKSQLGITPFRWRQLNETS